MIEKLKELNTAKKQLLISTAIFIAGFLVGGYFVILPDIRALKEVSDQKSSSEEKELVLSEIIRSERHFKNLSPILSKTRDADWLMETVNRMAGDSALKLLAAAPQAASVKGNYQKISLRLEAIGGYHAIGKFVEKIENNTPLVQMDSIQIERRKTGTESQEINVVMSISTFYFPKGSR